MFLNLKSITDEKVDCRKKLVGVLATFPSFLVLDFWHIQVGKDWDRKNRRISQSLSIDMLIAARPTSQANFFFDVLTL